MSYSDFVRRSLTIVAIIVLVGIGLVVANKVLSILMIGFFCWIISVGLNVPIMALRRRGLERTPAVLITFAGVAIGIAVFIIAILPPLITQVADLLEQFPDAARATVEEYDNLRQSDQRLTDVLPEFTVEDWDRLTLNLEGSETADGAVPGGDLTGPVDESPPVVNPENVLSVLRSTLPVLLDFGSFLSNLAVNTFMVLFVSSYLILDPLIYYRMIIAIVPAAHEVRAVDILNKMRRTVITWLGALLISSSFTGISVTVILGVFLGIPNAIALGTIAALGNVIPNVGYWLALIPIGIFSVASAGPTQALAGVLAYIIVGEIEAKLISPTVIKNELNIPAGLMLLFQLVAGKLLGFFGILLAVPLLALINMLVRELYVFDSLGKAGRVSQITEALDGQLILQPVVKDEPA